MSNDRFNVLDRLAPLFEAPEPSFEAFLRRRDRKRRNQRIAAGVVGIAVFVAAVWIVTSVGSFDRTQTPAVPGGSETGPAETGPKVNVINLPPEGAPPSSPDHGELVLYVDGDGRGIAADRALTRMYLYADGRLIWWREGDLPAGATGHDILEQRLTPEGAELMRSEVIASGLFDRVDPEDMIPPGFTQSHDVGYVNGKADPDPLPFGGGVEVSNGERFVRRGFGGWYQSGYTIMTAEQEHALELLDARLADPASWLPASAWADQEIRAYVPTTYRVCYGGTTETIERDRLLHAIPGPVRELLEARDAEKEGFGDYVSFGDWLDGVRVTGYCSELTTEEARDVVRGLDDGGFERVQLSDSTTFEYIFSVLDPAGTAALWIDPYLPHGEAICIPCG
jgi:hypothetical protein